MQAQDGKTEPLEASLRVVSLFAFWFLLTLGLSGTGLALGLGEADVLVAIVFEALVLGFPPLVWVHLRLKLAGLSVETLMGSLPKTRAWVSWTALGLALAGFSLGTSWAAASFARAMWPDYFRALSASRAEFTATWPGGLVVWQVIDALLLGPFVLEFVFRGVVLRRFAYLWGVPSGVRAAVLFFALLYSLLHLDPVGAAALGLVTCLLYLETRCLWVPMFVHAVANAAQLAILAVVTAHAGTSDLEALRWPGTAAAMLSAPILVLAARRLVARLPAGLPPLT